MTRDLARPRVRLRRWALRACNLDVCGIQNDLRRGVIMQRVDPISGSPDRFGYSWARFSDLTPEQFEQFRRWTVLIDAETGWRDCTFLDVGCGAGRNSYWAMTLGARGGAAVDVDEASLSAARNTLAQFPTVDVEFVS